MKKRLLQRIATTGISLFLAAAMPATQTLGATMGYVIRPALNDDGGVGSGGSSDSGAGSGGSSDSGAGSGGNSDSGAGSGGSSDSGNGSSGSSDSGAGSGGSTGSGAGSGGSSDSGTGSGGSTASGAGSGGSLDSGAGSGGSTGSGAGSGGSSDSGAGSGGSADSGAGSGEHTDSGAGTGGGTNDGTDSDGNIDNGSNSGGEENDGTGSEESAENEVDSGGSTGSGSGSGGSGSSGLGSGTQTGMGEQVRKNETLKVIGKKEAGAYFAGEGTEESPYLIQTAKDLELIAKLMAEDYETYGNSCYQLSQNISMKKGRNNHTPIGNREHPFMGVFDGDGYVISGLRINSPRKEQQGLFGAVGETGLVRNVGLKENSICGKAEVGALAGVNSGTIEACFQTGEVFGISDSVGSIAGVNRGTVQDCYSTGHVYGGFKTGDDLPADQEGSQSKRAPRAGIRDFIMTVAETIAETIAETVAYVIEETKSNLETLYGMVTTAFSTEAEAVGPGIEDSSAIENDTEPEDGPGVESSIDQADPETIPNWESGANQAPGPDGESSASHESDYGKESSASHESGHGMESSVSREPGYSMESNVGQESAHKTESSTNLEKNRNREIRPSPETIPGEETGSGSAIVSATENNQDMKEPAYTENGAVSGTSEPHNSTVETELSNMENGGEDSINESEDTDAITEEILYLDDDNKQPAAGGIVGRNDGGAVSDSYQAGRQWARDSDWLVGGICGKSRDGITDNCYFVRGTYENETESVEEDGVTSVPLERITGEDALDRMGFDPEIWTGKQTEEDSSSEISEDTKPDDEGQPIQYRHYFPQLLIFEERNQAGPYTLGYLETEGLRIDSLSKRASVSTEEGWHWLFSTEDYLDYRITLEADLDLRGFPRSIGTWEKPFTGILDGNGHVITGLKQPLFGVMGEGSAVYYLLLDQSEITGLIYHESDGESPGGWGSGILAAYARGAMVDSCGVTGTIALPKNIQAGPVCVGGLIGEAVSGTSIYESYSFANLTEEAGQSRQVTTGGLIGLLGKDSGATNCYATGRLNCRGTVGGFAGENRGEIRDSFVTTIISPGAGKAGAFVGDMQGGNPEVSRGAEERVLLKMALNSQYSSEESAAVEEETPPEKETTPPGEETTPPREDSNMSGPGEITGDPSDGSTDQTPDQPSTPPSTQPDHGNQSSSVPQVDPAPSLPENHEGTTQSTQENITETTKSESPSANTSQLIKLEPLQGQDGMLSEADAVTEIWQNFTITGCAYDMQMSGCSDPYAEGLSTAEMTGEEAVLPGGSWYRTEGAYPQLMCMAYHTHETYILCSKASAIPLVLPGGITMYDLPVGEAGGEENGVRIEGTLEVTIPEQIDGDMIQWSDPEQMTVQGNGKAILDMK